MIELKDFKAIRRGSFERKTHPVDEPPLEELVSLGGTLGEYPLPARGKEAKVQVSAFDAFRKHHLANIGLEVRPWHNDGGAALLKGAVTRCFVPV
jgi:hypothetical protein